METVSVNPSTLDVVEIEEVQPTCHAQTLVNLVDLEEVAPTCHQ
jgi:hypothetical protein